MGVGRWMLLVPVLAAASLGAKLEKAEEPMTARQVMGAINSTHNRVWGDENLLLVPFNPAKGSLSGGVEAWNGLIQGLKTFVGEKLISDGEKIVKAKGKS